MSFVIVPRRFKPAAKLLHSLDRLSVLSLQLAPPSSTPPDLGRTEDRLLTEPVGDVEQKNCE